MWRLSVKKDKIKYNCLTGIILIIFNISMKFLIYGNTAIWLDDMPTYPSEERLSPEIEIFKSSMYRMIPFLIIYVCITIIYIRKMYDKKIYNKKTDVLFPIIILVVNLILVYFLMLLLLFLLTILYVFLNKNVRHTLLIHHLFCFLY